MSWTTTQAIINLSNSPTSPWLLILFQLISGLGEGDSFSADDGEQATQTVTSHLSLSAWKSPQRRQHSTQLMASWTD